MKYLKTVSFLCGSVLLFPANATILDQTTVNDPVLGSRTVVYEHINGFAVVEGDIIIGKVSELQNQGAVISSKVSGSRWQNGIVPFEMSEDLPFRNKLAILQAIDHWQSHSKIEFVELTSKNRYEYKDYVSFISAPGTTCSSFIGRQGGKQVINLAPRCNTIDRKSTRLNSSHT